MKARGLPWKRHRIEVHAYRILVPSGLAVELFSGPSRKSKRGTRSNVLPLVFLSTLSPRQSTTDFFLGESAVGKWGLIIILKVLLSTTPIKYLLARSFLLRMCVF